MQVAPREGQGAVDRCVARDRPAARLAQRRCTGNACHATYQQSLQRRWALDSSRLAATGIGS
eukprot:307815-Pyramimonas_sp.AAC.1